MPGRALVAAGTVIAAVALGGCESGESSGGSPPTESTSSETPSASAEAGESEAPQASTQVVIGSGAMAAPPPQDNTAAVSAQYVADTLYSNGLLYDNGVVHNPAYVSCQENITQTDFFQCYVQVPQVAPYWIDVTASTENIRFVFNSWA